ncbi:MAG TPA: hypothetical protein VMT76_15215 [Puia sp.]|nr:hypothetical protein [Puia sp.]
MPNRETVELNWITTSEENTDGKSWEQAGQTVVKGDASVQQQYDFIGNAPANEINYLNGNFTWSNMTQAEIKIRIKPVYLSGHTPWLLN